MSSDPKIITVDKKNIADYPDCICFINARHPAHPQKINWLQKRFSEGLRIKLAYVPGQKKAAGFIEYVPGENAWRAVSAKGYLFIHCLYVYPNKNKNKGLGSMLLSECIKEARQKSMNGVAVIAGNGAFMAGTELFYKNGFSLLETDGQGNDLLLHKLKDEPLPVINDWKTELTKYKGLHIVYSKQCPWVARMVKEVTDSKTAKQLNIQITELQTPAEAQHAPSLNTVFNLIYNGKLLSDRYISLTRFNNILKKEKLI
ncbi:hypothetical protein SAMN05444274_103118 [Mariniphaga anaerophila]|uniref:N-acetyltransferase domain-containing protein n=1 Tax=Mariniphaga anaerophila TaxID=1484053 RepID=A0A1M4XTK1_9BACT|nr:GNAT family N-acetyltransferase [Mariniphaga anaerophila]SHE96811.1 hypothetical protein SAMN05444274_103118 [Mariniphaga anaerophila]